MPATSGPAENPCPSARFVADNYPARYGWVCPICTQGLAPWVERCPCRDPRPADAGFPGYPGLLPAYPVVTCCVSRGARG